MEIASWAALDEADVMQHAPAATSRLDATAERKFFTAGICASV
jgi:hypothetical protein